MPSLDYCRQVESYLCQKNDGHLVRVVGPAFDVVSRWAADGVPFKVACEGIDRYFERYYRKGPRRRPIRVEFCDADVRDVFDQWRKATGLTTATAQGPEAPVQRRGPSLPEHLERALVRLSSARAMGRIDASADPIIDAVSRELDQARGAPGGLRGEARRRLIGRLADRDAELSEVARLALGADAMVAVGLEAMEELSGFRDQMAPERFARTQSIAVDRLVRARLGLPTLVFT